MKINKTKCFVSWVMALSLALLMLFPFSSAAFAADTTLSIGAPATVAAGSTFVVNINIGAVTLLNGYQFDITYDNSVIQVVGLEGGTGVSSGLVGPTVFPLNMWGFIPAGAPGRLRALGSLPGVSGATGLGYLAQIQFTVVGSAGQSSALSISNIELLDNAGNLISTTATGGLVTVGNAADTTRPTVLSVNPANAATGVAVSASVIANFSEAMDNATATTGTFTLMNGATSVTGNVSSSGNAATFTPSANLAFNTTYVATITTGVTDLAHNALATDYAWSFTTSGQPPAVTAVSIDPLNGNVTQGSMFTVTINIGAVTNFNSCQFDLAYNHSVIQVAGDEGALGVSDGLIGPAAVPIGMWGFIPTGTPGQIRVLEHLPGAAAVTGQGYLAKIQFEAVGATGQNSNLTLSNLLLFNNMGNNLPFSLANGAVTIVDFPLDITSVSLADATVGSHYSHTLNAEGGTGPYSWSASGLPSGLTISTAGVISGNPGSDGNFNVNVTVTDSYSPVNTVSQTLPLHIYPALQITTSALSDGSTARSYLATLSASGGKGPYSWSATGLPPGLNLSAAGVISGNPGSPGVFNINVTLTDSFSPANIVNQMLSLKIYLAGDANGDGSINMADVTKAERIILSLDSPTAGADANGDGTINMGDVTKIERIVLGLL